MNFVVDKPPTTKQFAKNLELKVEDQEFLGDMEALLRPEIDFNIKEAHQLQLVLEELVHNI